MRRRRNFLRDNLLYLKDIEKKLSKKNIRPSQAEAENLIRHFGRIGRLDFFTGQKSLSPKMRKSVDRALKARMKGEPLSYLMKKADFYGHTFFVSKDTLIPRPETEVLVEEALKLLAEFYSNSGPAPKVLDVGTGSGCIAVSLTIARPDCRMTALEVSQKALRVARKNLEYKGLGKSVTLIESDLFSFFGEKHKAFWDLIVSNPPYIPKDEISKLSKEVRSEPRLALDGGPGGLRVIHLILEKAPYFLKSGGWLLLEIGKGHSQALAKKILKGGVFKNFKFVKDLAGIERVLVAQKK